MKVEIRWLVDKADGRTPPEFESFLRRVDEKVTPVAIEKVFKAWLEEKVRGKNIIVSDLEILVDGEFYILEREEENRLFRRIGDASGR
ncbi:MAG TPA: hypothetical protein VLU38_03255 [Methanomassiliicoccales archaeon]|nr:hypothetical protein [Methanomassiliicoccales archaeon]